MVIRADLCISEETSQAEFSGRNSQEEIDQYSLDLFLFAARVLLRANWFLLKATARVMLETSSRVTVGLVTAALLAASVSIAVEPSAPAEVEQIVAASCSSVFGSQRPPACRIESINRHEDAIRVQVHWTSSEDGALRAKIIVFSPQRTREASRELSFDRASRIEERWEAIGLVIAALANAEMLSTGSHSSAPEALQQNDAASAAREPVVEEPETPSASRKASLYLDVTAALLGGSASSLALGGSLRASVDVGIPLRPELGLGFLVGSTPTDQMNLQPRLGVQLWLFEQPFGMALYLDGIMSVTHWSADRSGRREGSWSLRYGAAAGAILAFPLVSWMGLSARGGASLLAPRVEVLVEDQLLGNISPWGAEAELGFWFQF